MKASQHFFAFCNAAIASAGLAVSGCAETSGVMWLPKSEFDRAFAVAMDVARAEHCGLPVDRGAVRNKLMTFEQARGQSTAAVERSLLAFDRTISEAKSRFAVDQKACDPSVVPDPSRLEAYAAGVIF